MNIYISYIDVQREYGRNFDDKLGNLLFFLVLCAWYYHTFSMQ